jgi:hypothetical protein
LLKYKISVLHCRVIWTCDLFFLKKVVNTKLCKTQYTEDNRLNTMCVVPFQITNCISLEFSFESPARHYLFKDICLIKDGIILSIKLIVLRPNDYMKTLPLSIYFYSLLLLTCLITTNKIIHRTVLSIKINLK